MSHFQITSLNYISSGKKRSLINLDMRSTRDELDQQYLISDKFTTDNKASTFVTSEKYNNQSQETQLSVIRLEHGENIQQEKQQYEKFKLLSFTANKTFVLDKNADNTVNGDVNILMTTTKNIYPAYDLNSMLIQTPLMYNSGSEKQQNAEIYAPKFDVDVVKFLNVSDSTIVLTEMLSTDIIDLRASFNDNDSTELVYSDALSQTTQKMNLYSRPNELLSSVSSYAEYIEQKQIDEKMTVEECISNVVEPKHIYLNLSTNYLIDIEQSNRQLNYDSGSIYGQTFNAKSHYNSTYSQEVQPTYELTHMRKYIDIIKTSGTPYLKFYDNFSAKPISTTKTEITAQMSQNTTYPYQKIERIYPAKISSTSKHKSNLFSITINQTSINELKSEELKTKVKFDISNTVKEIVKNICPANTQLFEVNFS